ncbi:MAG TPA: cytochrome c, partial [Anaeromyxobacteraceae bacterium]|nr:cytochrome c [Anaeromyxobacteraceae bacterium]
WAAALHAVALPAAVAIAVARFRATVPPPVRWVPIAGALGTASVLLLAASVRLASPRAASTLVALFGPLLGGVFALLCAAFLFSLVERQWATGLTAVALALALVADTVPLSFMTTPGAWPASRALPDALLNPSLLPLLLGRLGAVAALCGTSLLLHATRGGDGQRPRAATAGGLLALGGAALGGLAAWAWLRAVGPRPVEALMGPSFLTTAAATVSTWGVPAFAAAAILAAFISLTRSRVVRRGALSLLVVLAVTAAGAAEVARVGLSGAWVLGAPGQGWLLANGLTADEAEAAVRSGLGAVLPALGAGGAKGSPERGGRILQAACAPCHSTRGLSRRLDGWPRAAIAAAVARLDRLSPASPAFPGNAADVRDLALHLALLDGSAEGAPVAPPDPTRVASGRRLFAETCAGCHREIRLERRVAGWNEPLAQRVVSQLNRMNPAMPRFDLGEADRQALAAYLVTLGR